MNVRTQVIVAIFIVVALVIIVNMIRKKALELRYALSWMMVGTGVLILDLFPGIMEWGAEFMGIELPINMLFFLGFCFALIIIFALTISISHMSVQIKNLTQELALYEKQQSDEEK